MGIVTSREVIRRTNCKYMCELLRKSSAVQIDVRLASVGRFTSNIKRQFFLPDGDAQDLVDHHTPGTLYRLVPLLAASHAAAFSDRLGY